MNNLNNINDNTIITNTNNTNTNNSIIKAYYNKRKSPLIEHKEYLLLLSNNMYETHGERKGVKKPIGLTTLNNLNKSTYVYFKMKYSLNLNKFTKTIKTREDMQLIATNTGKLFLNLDTIGYYLPPDSCFDSTFFFQVMVGKKKVFLLH